MVAAVQPDGGGAADRGRRVGLRLAHAPLGLLRLCAGAPWLGAPLPGRTRQLRQPPPRGRGCARARRRSLNFADFRRHLTPAGRPQRWWDFVINGRTVRGNERTFHHYAAQLNSVPLFDQALRSPGDAWMWRLAACGGNGFLTNIRPEDGTVSMGWHGDPDMLTRDAYSADFGPGFYGHWRAVPGARDSTL